MTKKHFKKTDYHFFLKKKEKNEICLKKTSLAPNQCERKQTTTEAIQKQRGESNDNII